MSFLGGHVTLAERIELEIFRFVEQVGKGQRRSVLFPQLTQLVSGANNIDVMDALVRLHDRGFITLERFERDLMNYVSYSAFGGDRRNFFSNLGGDFGITVTAEGRLDLERREQTFKAPAVPSQKPHVLQELKRIRSALADQDTILKDVPRGNAGPGSPIRALFNELDQLVPGRFRPYRVHGNPVYVRQQISVAMSTIDAVFTEIQDQETQPTDAATKVGVGTEFKTAFGTYTAERVIGEGGSGRVFAVLRDDDQRFALKCLHRHAITQQRRRFTNEMQFCARTAHENIIRVIDWGIIGDNSEIPFFVMPLFPKTLRQLMTDGIAPRDVLPLFVKILQGVEAAHAAGVWHRDLKPENILCDLISHALVVTDFGIAHFAEPLLHTLVNTGPRDKLANFTYAAPEQRTRGQVDQRADIYAIGLILNEMFTNEVALGSKHKLIGSWPRTIHTWTRS